MCYAKPGPRCDNAYKQSYVSTIANVMKVDSSIDTVRANMLQSVSKGETIDTKDLEQLHALEQRKIELNEKLVQIQEKRDATEGGLQRLDRSINRKVNGSFMNYFDLSEKDQEEYDGMIQRYNKGNAEYNAQLKAYDSKFDTVNGKQPSKLYLETEKLRQEFHKTQSEYTAMKDEESELAQDAGKSHEGWVRQSQLQDSLVPMKKKLAAQKKKYHHAMETSHRVNNEGLHVSLPPEAWEREQHLMRKSSEAASARGNVELAHHYNVRSVQAKREKLISANDGKVAMPTLMDSSGNPSKWALAYDESKRTWNWTDGEEKVPVGSTDQKTRVETKQGTLFVSKDALVPAKVNLLMSPTTGRETTQIVPVLSKIQKNPESVELKNK